MESRSIVAKTVIKISTSLDLMKVNASLFKKFIEIKQTKILLPCPFIVLKTREGTGTSEIEIHFSIQTTKFLLKYNLFCFQISNRLILFFSGHNYEVLTSYINKNKKY